MVAGQAMHRYAGLAEEFPEPLVTLPRFVLHQVAGGQDQVRPARIGERMFKARHQAGIGIDATHLRLTAGMQVRVGDMQDAHGAVPEHLITGVSGAHG